MNFRFQAISRILMLAAIVLVFCSTAEAQKRYRVGYKDEGFSFIPEATLLIPSNTYDIAFNMNAIFGGQFGPHLFVGGGVGLDAYESDMFVPVFVDARYFFLDDQFSPYGMLDAGYALPADVSAGVGGGPMVTPGVGIKYFMSRTTALNLALVYRYQSMPIDIEAADASTSLRSNYIQSFGVRLGLQF